MNIFITDLDPVQSAINLDDKRVKHMPKECVELLGIYIHSVLGRWVIPFPLWGNDDRNEPNWLYNHPCSKWVRKNKANAWWLLRHTKALIAEYKYRTGLDHPCLAFMEEIEAIVGYCENNPESFQNSSLHKNKEITTAYRETMIHKWFVTDKIKPVRWTGRKPPLWLGSHNQNQQTLDL